MCVCAIDIFLREFKRSKGTVGRSFVFSYLLECFIFILFTQKIDHKLFYSFSPGVGRQSRLREPGVDPTKLFFLSFFRFSLLILSVCYNLTIWKGQAYQQKKEKLCIYEKKVLQDWLLNSKEQLGTIQIIRDTLGRGQQSVTRTKCILLKTVIVMFWEAKSFGRDKHYVLKDPLFIIHFTFESL